MAQTKKKRRSKHRGNAAGVVEVRGRSGHKRPDPNRKLTGKELAAKKREERMMRPPSWRSATIKAAAAALLLAVLGVFVLNETPAQAASLTIFVFLFYIPLGYYTDSWIYKRRVRTGAKAKAKT